MPSYDNDPRVTQHGDSYDLGGGCWVRPYQYYEGIRDELKTPAWTVETQDGGYVTYEGDRYNRAINTWDSPAAAIAYVLGPPQ
jgi:hypothetical protein